MKSEALRSSRFTVHQARKKKNSSNKLSQSPTYPLLLYAVWLHHILKKVYGLILTKTNPSPENYPRSCGEKSSNSTFCPMKRKRSQPLSKRRKRPTKRRLKGCHTSSWLPTRENSYLNAAESDLRSSSDVGKSARVSSPSSFFRV